MANDIKLQEGTQPLDSNLRPLKFGNKVSALELAQSGNGARVRGDLDTDDINCKDITLNESIIAENALTITASGTNGHLTLDPDGDLIVSGADTKIDATKKLYLDGGGDTYICETHADNVRFVVGNDAVLELTESGGRGNKVDFNTSAAGFTSFAATYGATNTNINFNQFGQKAEIALTGNVINLNLLFPDVSCNCILIIKQDGTGSRLITNYITLDQDAGNSGTLYFPSGGTSPTLSTGANATDILSIYWDNSRHTAYGIMSLNFEASS